MPEIECLRYVERKKGRFLGFADLRFSRWQLEVYGCTVFVSENGEARNVRLPTKEYVNDQGETKYAPLVRFVERAHQDAFSEAALKAIDKFKAEHPECMALPSDLKQVDPDRKPSNSTTQPDKLEPLKNRDGTDCPF